MKTITNTNEISSTDELNLRSERLLYIGQYIKQLRLYEGLSQNDAALLIGINRISLQNAEYGHNITLTTIFKIVDFYDLSLSEIFVDVE